MYDYPMNVVVSKEVMFNIFGKAQKYWCMSEMT